MTAHTTQRAKTRVLLTFHSLVTLSNHRLPEELARYDDLELHIFVPTAYPEEARDVRLEKTADPTYSITAAPIASWTRRLAPNTFFYRGGLGRVLKTVQPHIFDFYEEAFSTVAAQALTLRRLHAPQSRLMFYSAQNIYKSYPPPFRWVEQWTYRAADHAHVCNSEAADILRRKGFAKPVTLLPLGVDAERFRPPAPDERATFRATLGIRDGQAVIGYLGRMHREKGVADLLDAFARLRTTRPTDSTRLLMVGDGPHKADITQKATDLGLADAIIWTGAIPRTAVPQYLGAMDCLAVPSRTMPNWKEQFGRIIIEAQLCNVPVIGSSCGSIPEVTGTDGETGLIYPEGDSTALAAQIARVLDDATLHNHLSVQGRARALADYTWPVVARKRYAIYRQLSAATVTP